MEPDSSIHLTVLPETGLGCILNKKLVTVLNNIGFHFRGRENSLTLLCVSDLN